MQRMYLAVVEGFMNEDTGFIDLLIARKVGKEKFRLRAGRPEPGIWYCNGFLKSSPVFCLLR